MTTEIHHPIFARVFDRASRKVDEGEQREHRRRLLAGLTGRVLEIGAGNGLNFAHYPPTVAEVVAVEPEPYLRSRAADAARRAPVLLTVVPGTAEALPFDDGAFDAAVASLVLCSVERPATALAELRRVLRAGGELRFYEHVLSSSPRLARWQRRADHVWPLVAGGCHTGRDTLAAIRDAGFEVETVEELVYKPASFATLTSPHVLGRARSAG